MAYDYDLITIGAGSGGVAASRRAGAYGARVAIVEEGRVGGTCVLRGCVPKKLLVHAAHVREEIDDAAGYGWRISAPSFDWPTLIANKNAELERHEGIYHRMLADAGVELLQGTARVVDAHTLEISNGQGARRASAERILVATGGWPEMPPVAGVEHAITSNEALDLAALPERMVIAGGGYVAVEFAGIFSNLGVEVTIVIRADHILRGFDHDLRLHLEEEMRVGGVTIRPDCKITEIRADGNAFAIATTDGVTLAVDCLFFATGRKPNTARLGLREAGVALADNGAIAVDADLATSVPSLYAIGDCTDRNNLTPVAIAEGRALAETWFNGNPQRIDYGDIATAVFSQPPIGTVGLSEEAARLASDSVAVYRSTFRPLKNTLSGNPARSMMKLVVDGDSDRVLGCHIIGADAPEIVQGMAIAIKCGATKAQFDATMAIHPTSAEELVTMYQPATS